MLQASAGAKTGLRSSSRDELHDCCFLNKSVLDTPLGSGSFLPQLQGCNAWSGMPCWLAELSWVTADTAPSTVAGVWDHPARKSLHPLPLTPHPYPQGFLLLCSDSMTWLGQGRCHTWTAPGRKPRCWGTSLAKAEDVPHHSLTARLTPIQLPKQQGLCLLGTHQLSTQLHPQTRHHTQLGQECKGSKGPNGQHDPPACERSHAGATPRYEAPWLTQAPLGDVGAGTRVSRESTVQ